MIEMNLTWNTLAEVWEYSITVCGTVVMQDCSISQSNAVEYIAHWMLEHLKQSHNDCALLTLERNNGRTIRLFTGVIQWVWMIAFRSSMFTKCYKVGINYTHELSDNALFLVSRWLNKLPYFETEDNANEAISEFKLYNPRIVKNIEFRVYETSSL